MSKLARWVLPLTLTLFACGTCDQQPAPGEPCTYVSEDFGPAGTAPVVAETVVSGLEVPWSIIFLPGGDWLVSERPGRIRLVSDGALASEPVATVEVLQSGEAGLLGLALDPSFSSNRRFFLYATVEENGQRTNRIERWILSADHRSAFRERILFTGINGASVHDGGRLRFGPDGMLYACTGDARQPDSAQDPESKNGKVLRLTPDGEVPPDNPREGNPLFLLGIRNCQGIDWYDDRNIVIADHGPSGELLRSGNDEINLARAGDNLGWPTIYGCQSRAGLLQPRLSWKSAVPPGGAAFYRGDEIPEWKGSLLVGTLGSRHLHRVEFEAERPHRVRAHEVYFEGDPPRGLGRVRDVVAGPDGKLYATTSNCDGRGTCPPEKDRIVRFVRQVAQ